MDLQKRLDFIAEVKKKIYKSPESGNEAKKTAISRMNALFDEGTFVELNAFVKKRLNEFPENKNKSIEYEGIVSGYGSVGGRLVFAYSQDFSKISGALSEAGVKKILAVYDMAEKNGAPVVSVFDSSGVVVTEGIDVLSGYGEIIKKASVLSGIVPQYSVICGTCAGGAAVIASISDFIFIEKNNGKIFINSPFIIKNKNANKTENFDENIGNAEFAAENGQCAKIADGEDELFASMKNLMEYIPSNNFDENVYIDAEDDANRLNENLADFVLTEKYDMKQVITEISDNNKFYEIYENYSANILCGFISMANTTVGVVANQPKELDGAICPGACDKAARFIYVCDNFNIPVLTLVDTEGMIISEKAEKSQFSLYAAKLASAYAYATVPKITLNIGKSYGTAYTIMGSKGLGIDIVMAYPAAQIAVLPSETAVEIIYGDDIMKDPDPAKKRAELTEMWETEKSSPTEAAANGSIDMIIEPGQTRQMITSAILLLQSKRETRLPKKYNKLPF
ncbi:MAG: methylmalonyl-CoA carboxyltransferase [Oscillospiraceae bacterium]|nr:methylmalonyl-CoA carboxyltransferase [Oscillospiraceae bacterium]